MRNCLKNYSLWIEDSKSTITVKAVKKIKPLNSQNLALLACDALENAITQFRSLPDVASTLGSTVLPPRKQMDERERSLENFHTGYHLLNVLVDHDIIKFEVPEADDRKQIKIKKGEVDKKKPWEQDPRKISIVNRAWINNLLDDRVSAPEMESMVSFPQRQKPRDWDRFYHPIAGELVHNASRRSKRSISKRKTPLLFQAINTLQNIAYELDKDVYDVLTQVSDSKIFTLEDEINNASEAQQQEKAFISRIAAKQRVNDTIMKTAKIVYDWEEFYQYYFMDNRVGRLYTQQKALKSDGCDLEKGLMQFKEKKVWGSEGFFWHKFHLTNSWGEDKLSIDDRVSFAEDRLEMWAEIGRNPVANRLWEAADNPVVFLQACIDLAKAIDTTNGKPETYSSGIIVGHDASNSGLQIYSAFSRNYDIAKLCNLAGTTRGDYYLTVGDHIIVWNESYAPSQADVNALEMVLRDLNGKTIVERETYFESHQDSLWKLAPVFWHKHFKARRSLCKRPGMTWIYSCGPDRMGEHIYADHCYDQEFAGINEIFANWLGHEIYNSCRKVIKAAANVKDLLTDEAEKLAENGQQVTFVTNYTGAVFSQDYTDDKSSQVWCKYKHAKADKKGNKRMRVRFISVRNHELDLSKIYTSTAVNIIHCGDSEFAKAIVNKTSYTVVTRHDQFLTHAADAGKLFEDTRTIFHDMFYKEDVLNYILKQINPEAHYELEDYDGMELFDNEFCFS